MSVYAMVGINKHDPVTYDQYVANAMVSVEKYGVEALAVSDAPRTVEGSNPCGRYVLLRFADQAAFDTWYNSPEYQAARPLRLASAETLFFVTVDSLL